MYVCMYVRMYATTPPGFGCVGKFDDAHIHVPRCVFANGGLRGGEIDVTLTTHSRGMVGGAPKPRAHGLPVYLTAAHYWYWGMSWESKRSVLSLEIFAVRCSRSSSGLMR